MDDDGELHSYEEGWATEAAAGAVVPQDVIIPSGQDVVPTTTPSVPDAPQKAEESLIEKYLREEHPSAQPVEKLTPENAPWLSFDKQGRITLYNDPGLHEALGLSDDVRVVQNSNGVNHYAYDTTLDIPKFHGQHDVEPITAH